MDKSKILECLDVLSKAQTGYKLSKTTGEWYPSSGIFSAIYRTVAGESRKDILDLMDMIVQGLDEFKNRIDVQAQNEIIMAIGEAGDGCDKIIETYRDDQNFIDEFNQKRRQILEFKNPKPKNISSSIPKEQLHKFTNVGALSHSVNSVLNSSNAKTGVAYINELIKNNQRPTNDHL